MVGGTVDGSMGAVEVKFVERKFPNQRHDYLRSCRPSARRVWRGRWKATKYKKKLPASPF